MSADITLLGEREVHDMLGKAMDPALKKTLQRATTASAKFLKPKVVAAAPRGKTGRLKKSISATQARRERPAAIVKARPKIAFYRHFVMRGTKAHRIRFPDQKAAGVPKAQGNIEHPGARANPFIDETSDRYGRQAMEVATDLIRKEIG